MRHAKHVPGLSKCPLMLIKVTEKGDNLSMGVVMYGCNSWKWAIPSFDGRGRRIERALFFPGPKCWGNSQNQPYSALTLEISPTLMKIHQIPHFKLESHFSFFQKPKASYTSTLTMVDEYPLRLMRRRLDPRLCLWECCGPLGGEVLWKVLRSLGTCPWKWYNHIIWS